MTFSDEDRKEFEQRLEEEHQKTIKQAEAEMAIRRKLHRANITTKLLAGSIAKDGLSYVHDTRERQLKQASELAELILAQEGL